MKINRRDFITQTLSATALSMVASSAWSQPLGANGDIRVGVVGFNSKGATHIDSLIKIPGVRVVALCDVDEKVLAREKKKFTDRQEQVKTYQDVRKLLADNEIDAVSIATPNHWHSLMTIWACQAGKDVYVEKPVSHNVWEGRKAVEAARKYNRIVQAGTQNRSDIGLLEVMPFLQQGGLGKILYTRALCYRQRNGIGKAKGPQPIPAGIDYDLWTGPAPLGPLRREKLHYDWHWVWDTGNGDIGNQGIHEMDLCRWVMQEKGLPRRVISVGGRFAWDDDGRTPNMEYCILDYDSAPLIFEVINLTVSPKENWMPNIKGTEVGIIVQCENGYFAGGRNGGWTYDNDGKKLKKYTGDGGGEHHANFIAAVRSRKVSDLRSDIEEGHLSSAMCHLCNVSHQLGRKAAKQEILEALGSRLTVADDIERFYKQVSGFGIDLEKTPFTLGMTLDIDPVTETVKRQGDYDLTRWANDMIHGSYRAPFVVPDKV